MSSILSSLLPLVKPQLSKLLSNPDTLKTIAEAIEKEKEKEKYELKPNEDDVIMYAACNKGRIIVYVAAVELILGKVYITRHLKRYTEKDLTTLINKISLL